MLNTLLGPNSSQWLVVISEFTIIQLLNSLFYKYLFVDSIHSRYCAHSPNKFSSSHMVKVVTYVMSGIHFYYFYYVITKFP